MHPVIFSEIHQSKRSLPWQLLIILMMSAILQYALGLSAVLLLLLPTGAAAIGVAAFSEEHSKGYLRFFYSMPISPSAIWWVKVFAGILVMGLFVAVVLLPAFFIPSTTIEFPGVGDLHDVSSELINLFSGGLVLILFAAAVLSYAAGLFTIGFCQIKITAGLLASFISIGPFMTYALLASSGELAAPNPTTLAFGLLVASLPLWIGAYVLFRSRNPFVDQPWVWRGKAAVFGSFYGVVTIGIAYAFGLHPAELTDPYRDGVYYFSVHGDDSEVFVLGRRTLWDVESYLLDSGGHLARHLFHVDRAIHLMPDRLREATDSSMILCEQANGSLRSSSDGHRRFLLNLNTGEQTPVGKHLLGDSNTHYDYRRISDDGRSILGFKEIRDDSRRSYSAFRQDLLSAEVRETPVYEGSGYPACLYLHDRRILVSEMGSDNPGKTNLTIIDLQSGKRTVRELPSDVHETFLSSDGRKCAAHRWTFEGEIIHQELTVLDIVTGVWKTLLTPEELPVISVKDAARSKYPILRVSFPDRHTDWVFCTVENPSAAPARFLIHCQNGVRFQLPEKDKGEVSRFSKDGSRFITILHQHERGSRDARLLTFYEIKKTGIEYLNSFPWEQNAELVWLGNDRLIYLKHGDRDRKRLSRHRRILSDFFSDRGELWTVDIKTGQHRPFFAGTHSVANQ